jgi:hypothetical protein
MNFGVKKSIVRMTQKMKTLVFECNNLADPMELRAVTFWD